MLALTTLVASTLLLADAAKDELALVRVSPAAGGKLALRIHQPPGQAGTTLGHPLGSDETFFALTGAQPTKFVFAADADGDTIDELCVVRHAANDPQKLLRIKTYSAPTVYGGEVGKPLATSKKGTLPRFAKQPKPGSVAAAGAGDSDGDGIDELWLIVHGENGVQSLQVRALPTTKNEPLDVVTKSIAGIDTAFETSVVSVCGIDRDGDDRDEVAILRRAIVGSTLAIYQAPEGIDEPAVKLAESVFIPGSTTMPPRAICRIRFDGDAADEIGVLSGVETGDGRFQVFEPPVGIGQFLAPALFSDSGFDVASDASDAVFVAGLRGYSFEPPPAQLGSTWSATYRHTVNGVKETIVVDHGILAQQAGGVLSFHFPLFKFAQGIYSPTAKSLEFTTSPIELNAPGTGSVYGFVYSPGLVFAGSTDTFVACSYTGYKKLPLGQVAQIGDGVVLFQAHAP